MNIEPYPDGTPLMNSQDVPRIEMIDDLIRYLVTVRHRFGNTTVAAYRVRWGASALWAQHDAEKLVQLTERLRTHEGDSVELLCDNPEGDPNNAVVCRGEWCCGGMFAHNSDAWQNGVRFEGETLLKALEAAIAERQRRENTDNSEAKTANHN
jgi:hypothetical protein